jgi:hypothetical protein
VGVIEIGAYRDGDLCDEVIVLVAGKMKRKIGDSERPGSKELTFPGDIARFSIKDTASRENCGHDGRPMQRGRET